MGTVRLTLDFVCVISVQFNFTFTTQGGRSISPEARSISLMYDRAATWFTKGPDGEEHSDKQAYKCLRAKDMGYWNGVTLSAVWLTKITQTEMMLGHSLRQVFVSDEDMCGSEEFERPPVHLCGRNFVVNGPGQELPLGCDGECRTNRKVVKFQA